MALTAGTKLGSFEITGQLGAGGMGEVFRATDTRLGREVAIKLLPPALADDEERLARFEREAKLLASLNHAHIGSIYSLDDQDGTRFIAMELIEGETLEQKLESGALPVEEALQLGLQIASALEAAHGKGVVHRDLKPANIIVSPDGVAKVLDFGLAKAFSADTEESDPLHSPTLSAAMTQQGLILGTAGYMSPEQASGQAADQRADIWSFGVVLYEMITGLPVFRGESVPHILAAVLEREPEWERLPERLNPRVRELLECCLEKKARNRYHSIADARIAIERALRDPEGHASFGGKTQGRRGGGRFALAAGALALVAALSVAVTVLLRPPAEPGLTSRFPHLVPQAAFRPIAYLGTRVLDVAPGGDYFVYMTDVANGGLMLRPLDEIEARPVQGANNGTWPVVSPSGEEIAYFYKEDEDEDAGEIRKISRTGGQPDVVVSEITSPLGISWADGEFLVGQVEGIFSVDDRGGPLNPIIARRNEQERLHGPQLLPDLDSVLFTVVRNGSWDDTEIAVESRTTGERKTIVPGGTNARYTSSGHLVWARGEDLLAARFDLDSLTISDSRSSVVRGVFRTGSLLPARVSNFALSASGTLVYLQTFESALAMSLIQVDRDGNESGALPCDCQDISLSPDATKVVLQANEPDGKPYIAVLSFEEPESMLRRLTPLGRRMAVPVWGPTADRVVYSEMNGPLYSQNADGSDEPTLFHQIGAFPYGFGPDGELLIRRRNSEGQPEIAVRLPSGEIVPLIRGNAADRPALSPNGRWLAYQSDETGETEIYVVRFPENTNKTLISRGAGSGTHPQWDADGNLFFFGETNTMQASKSPDPDFGWDLPLPLFAHEAYNKGPPHAYAVMPDGKFLMMKEAEMPEVSIIVAQNWLDELTARLE